jgi:hypothetical protein
LLQWGSNLKPLFMKFIIDYFGVFETINADNLKDAFFWAKKFSTRNVRSITDEQGKQIFWFDLIKL